MLAVAERWGKGYQFGSVPDEDSERARCASLAYADDLQMLASSASDLGAQADKLTQYSNWAQMAVNTGKTFASGILHAEAAAHGGHKQVAGMLRRRLEAQVRVQGQPVQVVASDAPFLYLGVTMTLTLDWRHNYASAIRKAKEQAQSVRTSWGKGHQKVKMAETVVRAGIASSFSVAPFTPVHIRMLDGVLVGMYKQAYGQRRSTPTAMVQEDVQRFGMGCTSLLVGYTHECIKRFTEAYNDEGAYGMARWHPGTAGPTERSAWRPLGGRAGDAGDASPAHTAVERV